VDPTDFFKTAELLKLHAEETHLRTSISRSYYAAFLYFRERLRKLGLEKKRKPNFDAHAFVIQCLGYSQVQESNKASKYLHDLQQLREDADYHLGRTFSQNEAEDALAKAKKIVTDYEKNITPTKERTIFDNASAYARRKDWI
jgi:uncharacterized protein (UPF0332 family)